MASSYTVLGTEKMTTGENAGTWGTTTNTNLEIVEQAFGGYLSKSIAGGVQTTTLAITDGDSTASTSEARHHVIKLTGTITGNQTVTVPADIVKSYIVSNATSGAYTVLFKTASGSGFTFATTNKGVQFLFADGTNVVDTGIGSVGAYDLDGGELTLDADSDTSITASSDDQIDFEIAGADDFTMTANAFNVLTGSHATFADSANAKFGTGNDMLLYHDGTNSYITNAQGALKVATETSGIAITIGHTTSETTVADNLTVTGTLTGTLATAAQGSVTSLGTLTTLTVDNVIVNGTTIGHTSDTDLLTLTSAVLTVAGELDAATLDISGNADIDGTTNLDIVDIDGAVQLDSTFTVGADDQGYDIKFFGDTASAYMLWDTSADDLVLAGAAGIDLAGDIDVDGTANLDAVDIDGAVQIDNTVTVGVNGTGYDVKFFGATSGAYMLWDESTDDLVLAGAAKLYLYDAGGGEYISSSGSALTIASGSAAWELPASDGSSNQVLKTDGSGNLDWVTSTGTITALNNATANEIVTVGSTTTELDAEGNFTYDGNNAALTSSTSTNPIISVTNTNTDANGSILRFIKDAGEAGAANDISGLISFYADDAGQNNQEFGRITGRVVDATAGGEEGALDFYVAEYDGTVTKGMEIKGLASDGNITVDISTHDGSAGGLMLGSTLVTATATELNLMDGGTTAGTTAVASGDGIVTNDGGTMRQTTTATFDTYLSGSTQTLTNKTLTAPKFADAGYIADASGNELVILQTTGSAVNQFDIANAATGNDPTITATGGDSHVGLGLVAKGTGVIQITSTMNPTITSTGKALVMGF